MPELVSECEALASGWIAWIDLDDGSPGTQPKAPFGDHSLRCHRYAEMISDRSQCDRQLRLTAGETAQPLDVVIQLL